MKKRAKVVAVAKAIHKFIAYCHAKLIALLTAQTIHAIGSCTDKNKNRNSAISLAWYAHFVLIWKNLLDICY